MLGHTAIGLPGLGLAHQQRQHLVTQMLGVVAPPAGEAPLLPHHLEIDDPRQEAVGTRQMNHFLALVFHAKKFARRKLCDAMRRYRNVSQ